MSVENVVVVGSGPAGHTAAIYLARAGLDPNHAKANPAITIGRTITDTFSGIAPSSALWYIAAQFAGAALGVTLLRTLTPRAIATR